MPHSQALDHQSESHSSTEHAEPSEKRLLVWRANMTKLWRLMTERYGHRWASQNGQEWNGETWAEDLAGLRSTEFALGVRLDLERDDEWPPGSKAFRRMATSERKPDVPALPDHHRRERPSLSHREIVAARWRAYQIVHLGRREFAGCMTRAEAEEVLESAPLDEMRRQVELGKQRIRDGKRP